MNQPNKDSEDPIFVYFIENHLSTYSPVISLSGDTGGLFDKLEKENENEISIPEKQEKFPYTIYHFKIYPEKIKERRKKEVNLKLILENQKDKFEYKFTITDFEKNNYLYDLVFKSTKILRINKTNTPKSHKFSRTQQFQIYLKYLEDLGIKKKTDKKKVDLVFFTQKLLNEKFMFSFYILLFLESFNTKNFKSLFQYFDPQKIEGQGNIANIDKMPKNYVYCVKKKPEMVLSKCKDENEKDQIGIKLFAFILLFYYYYFHDEFPKSLESKDEKYKFYINNVLINYSYLFLKEKLSKKRVQELIEISKTYAQLSNALQYLDILTELLDIVEFNFSKFKELYQAKKKNKPKIDIETIILPRKEDDIKEICKKYKHNQTIIPENNISENQDFNTVPVPISNTLNKSQTNRMITNISKMQSKKQSQAGFTNRMSKRKSSILSKSITNKNSINISFDQMSPTSDLLLDLYNRGMYDQLNPSHQRGIVKMTEKQKSKWKLPDNHPLVYAANIKDFHPFCFFYGTKYKDLVKENGETKYPEGKLVNYRDWQVEPDYSLNGIYKGIQINPKVGLVIVDPIVKKKYQGLVADIIIQLLKVPFGHHMCLNVRIFEPKCLEERLTNVFSYANKYLIMASDPLLDTYERFKLVITFIFSGLYIPAQQLKPFNPYVGETFQGELPNGAKVYCEQVTHKPLCVRFYMYYKNVYKLYGYFNFDVRSEGLGSTMYVCQQGPCIVDFPQLGEKVTFNVPEIKIVNARNENGRANLYSGAMNFVDIKNNYRALIQFDFNKKKFHEIRGCILKCIYQPGFKFDYSVEWPSGKKMKLDKLKNDPNFLEEIKGSWITELVIGNKQYWDIKAQTPEFIKPTKTCLPSDGRFREDLCWLYKSFYNAKNETERKTYEKISQWWKVLMEDHNRWERKRRAEYNAKLLKKK